LVEFRDGNDAVEIGAGLTLTQIGEYWIDAPRVFREWLPLFASVLIRNRATLGGNLATASPIGDSAPMLLALDAVVRIAGPSGERIIPLSDFFKGYRQTALGPGEILRSIRIPKPFPEHARFYKAAKRSLDDISTVAACFAVSQGKVRLAYGGVAAVPLRAREAERLLEESADLERVKASLRNTLRPIGDHRGSAEYRLALAQSLLDKFWFDNVRQAILSPAAGRSAIRQQGPQC
jgi:xanthine dehydrogenase small subunit